MSKGTWLRNKKEPEAAKTEPEVKKSDPVVVTPPVVKPPVAPTPVAPPPKVEPPKVEPPKPVAPLPHTHAEYVTEKRVAELIAAASKVQNDYAAKIVSENVAFMRKLVMDETLKTLANAKAFATAAVQGAKAELAVVKSTGAVTVEAVQEALAKIWATHKPRFPGQKVF